MGRYYGRIRPDDIGLGDVMVAEPHDVALAALASWRRVLSGKLPSGFTGAPALVILLHLLSKREPA